MRCRRCGHENEAGANFCSSCGHTPRRRDEETLSLAELDERLELDEELGEALAELPAGVGMLVVRRGPNAGSRYVLDRDGHLARAPPRLRHLPRRHHRVAPSRHRATRRPAATRSRDVGSLNGTYVDHERVDGAPLHHLAELQIGRFVLLFLVGGQPGVSEPASARWRATTSRSARCWRSSTTSSPTSRSRRSAFSRARVSSTPSARPSGYRKFYADDVARLRWILFQQKEHFLPLKVIKERLDELDPGELRARRRGTGAAPEAGEPEATPPSRGRRERRRSTEPHGRRPRRCPVRARRAGRRDAATADGSPHARAPPAFAPTLPLDDDADDTGIVARDGRRRAAVHPRRAGAGGGPHRRRSSTSSRSTGSSRPARETGDDGPVRRPTRSRSPGIAAGFFAHGIEARHLRMYCTSPTARRCCSTRCCSRTCASATRSPAPRLQERARRARPPRAPRCARRCSRDAVRDALAE